MVIPCTNCKARNPKYSSSCKRCNAPLTSSEEERRRQMRIESELREANGKEPLDVPEVDESVEPCDPPSIGWLFMIILVIILVICLAVLLV